MEKVHKFSVILMVLGVFLSSCGSPCPDLEVRSGCLDFSHQALQSFSGTDFVINPLLFKNPTNPQGIPIEISIGDHDNDGDSELNLGSSSSGNGYSPMQVFFPSSFFPGGVDIVSVTLLHGHHAEISALAEADVLQDVASAPTQFDRTILVVEAGSRPIDSMLWDMEEAYIFKVCWGAEAVNQELTPPVEPVVITFTSFPDGTLVESDSFLSGDEYLPLGITLAGLVGPEEFADPPYCVDATVVAIHLPPRYGVTTNFLTAVRPGEIDLCNTIPIEIKFTSPVSEVIISFFGATTTYTLQAYEIGGNLLGEEQMDVVLENGIYEISYSSGNSDISRVVFGNIPVRPVPSFTAITQISYTP
jgi:hypothetical protein